MTDNEKAAYLRGRQDKAREVIQAIYCNHGGSSHPVYDFFQDSEIGYEEIIGWKLEAKQYLDQKIIESMQKTLRSVFCVTVWMHRSFRRT